MKVTSPVMLADQSLSVDRTHGGDNRAGLIDFSISINPLGPPPEALEAYHRAAADISLYPPPYPRALESHIAHWLAIDPESVLAANGSTQLIYLVVKVLKLRSPCMVIPTFSEIANALVASGSAALPIRTSSENNFCLDPGAVDVALRNGADGVFLGRPNSPTGSLVSFEEATEIAAQCHRRNAWCIFDEAFIEFASDSRSVVKLIGSFSKLLVLRSLTKIFAIPGLRLGYLVGHPKNVGMLRDAVEPWSVNVAAEAVARACIAASGNFITSTRALVASERNRLESGLGRLHTLRVFPSSANFIMVEVLDEVAPGDFARHLNAQGIAVRDLSALPGCGAGFYRFGIRTPSENARLLAAATDY